MAPLSQEKRNERPIGLFSYERHQPEETLLYQIIEEYWPCFQAELDRQSKSLPHFVAKEFDEHLKCGRLEHRCSSCHDEKLVAFSCKKRL